MSIDKKQKPINIEHFTLTPLSVIEAIENLRSRLYELEHVYIRDKEVIEKTLKDIERILLGYKEKFELNDNTFEKIHILMKNNIRKIIELEIIKEDK